MATTVGTVTPADLTERSRRALGEAEALIERIERAAGSDRASVLEPFDQAWLLSTTVSLECGLMKEVHPDPSVRKAAEDLSLEVTRFSTRMQHSRPLYDALGRVAPADPAEARLIDDLLEKIQEYAGAGGRGTIGLADTVQALNEQKIHILLVQEGFSQPGTECRSCGMLFAEERADCPACGEPAEQVENVVDSAIQKALELGSAVEVATEFEKLEPIQCIGSIMYY